MESQVVMVSFGKSVSGMLDLAPVGLSIPYARSGQMITYWKHLISCDHTV
jgi:hypothetical protein